MVNESIIIVSLSLSEDAEVRMKQLYGLDVDLQRFVLFGFERCVLMLFVLIWAGELIVNNGFVQMKLAFVVGLLALSFLMFLIEWSGLLLGCPFKLFFQKYAVLFFENRFFLELSPDEMGFVFVFYFLKPEAFLHD